MVIWRIKFHIVVWIFDGLSLVNERKSRVKTDRLALPIFHNLASSVRMVNSVLVTDFEVGNAIHFEGSYVAVGILGARARWQALQLFLVLRHEVDKV